MRYKKGKHTVLCISDLQIPYEHPDALDFCLAVDDEMNCDEVVCMGDEIDHHAMSRFDPHPEADGPAVELQKAIDRLGLWYKAFPEMKVCTSNHTRRIYKKAFHAGIPAAYLKDTGEWMQAPKGWKWMRYWVVDGVRYEHGDAAGGQYAARTLAIHNRQSTVIGHHHAHGGLNYVATENEVIFGMNTGCLIDFKSLAFEYASSSKFKPTLGVGVVDKGVPKFVPMITNARGRWTGDII
jgi:hypothetical protein